MTEHGGPSGISENNLMPVISMSNNNNNNNRYEDEENNDEHYDMIYYIMATLFSWVKGKMLHTKNHKRYLKRTSIRRIRNEYELQWYIARKYSLHLFLLLVAFILLIIGLALMAT